MGSRHTVHVLYVCKNTSAVCLHYYCWCRINGSARSRTSNPPHQDYGGVILRNNYDGSMRVSFRVDTYHAPNKCCRKCTVMASRQDAKGGACSTLSESYGTYHTFHGCRHLLETGAKPQTAAVLIVKRCCGFHLLRTLYKRTVVLFI